MEQSSFDTSKYYGRYNGDIDYEENKLNQKIKVLVTCALLQKLC